ncbi:hypothetical protein ACFQVA_07085 [Actinomadura keratinilytica]
MRQELLSLPKTLADDVARNLVMVARLIDEEPEEAYAYSRIALRLASRVAAVREAAGFAAYANQKYSEALAEFRAARRMTGSADLWPVMADCERGMGRPERALAMAGEPEVRRLDKAGQVEMRLVAAGARRDMDQLDAAIVTLQSPELASNSVQPWTARLRYAYADALLAAAVRKRRASGSPRPPSPTRTAPRMPPTASRNWTAWSSWTRSTTPRRPTRPTRPRGRRASPPPSSAPLTPTPTRTPTVTRRPAPKPRARTWRRASPPARPRRRIARERL